MKIIGIDPGTIITGYGVIEVTAKPRSSYRVIEFGVIEPGRIHEMSKRLAVIFTRLSAVIERVKPDEFAIETAFYDKSAQSAMKLGGARGVAMVTAELAGLPIAEYAPRVIKKAITGSGNADKKQVEFMIRKILSLKSSEVKRADAFDALAIAVTHASRRHSPKGSASNWKEFVEQNPHRVISK
jgi:crossover junction endodeoxyribonuclease RuvC